MDYYVSVKKTALQNILMIREEVVELILIYNAIHWFIVTGLNTFFFKNTSILKHTADKYYNQ